MAETLYTIYAIAVLLVAVGGLLAVTFRTPDLDERSDYQYKTLTIVAALFIAAMIGGFVL